MDKLVKLLIDGIETRLESVPDDDVYIAMSSEKARELIETLKAKSEEQEAVTPIPDYQIRYWRCPNCNWLLTSMIDGGCDIPVRRDRYCANCGMSVKWD